MSTASETRQRLLGAMEDSLQRRGFHASGLNDLLAAAEAPKGVMYHHFPGGKTELAEEAIRETTKRVLKALDRLFTRHPEPRAALAKWMESASEQLERSGFERGCPLAAVALEISPESQSLRTALAEAFGAMRVRIAAAFVAAGEAPREASALAALCISAYEGALLQARAGQSVEVIRSSFRALGALLAQRPSP